MQEWFGYHSISVNSKFNLACPTFAVMKKGVLLMAYGSPNNLEEVLPYYTDIRRGNPPTPEALEALKGRYLALGGKTPLLDITLHQAGALQEKLGKDYKVYVGMRHWEPWIYEAVEQMAIDGITDAVGLVMAPHYSSLSIAQYIKKVEEAEQKENVQIKFSYVKSYHNHPKYIQALEERIGLALRKFTKEERNDLQVIFTAHSLPERILQQNDPYPEQLNETSRILAENMDLPDWHFAYQSAGRTAEKWLGPDLLEVVRDLASKGHKAILVCSIGFIIDHLEVMYDIDIEAKEVAKDLGVHLERTASLNAHRLLIAAFEELVRERL